MVNGRKGKVRVGRERLIICEKEENNEGKERLEIIERSQCS